MPDEAKLEAMDQSGYRIVKNCSNCDYYGRCARETGWGTCSLGRMYIHGKHQGVRYTPSHSSMVCKDHRWSREAKHDLGEYFDEPWRKL